MERFAQAVDVALLPLNGIPKLGADDLRGRLTVACYPRLCKPEMALPINSESKWPESESAAADAPEPLIASLLDAVTVQIDANNLPEAEKKALEAFQLARDCGAVGLQTKALQLLAKLAGARGEQRPAMEQLKTAGLHGDSRPDYFVPRAVLLELAQAYAEVNLFELAYKTCLRAQDVQKPIAVPCPMSELERERKLAALESNRAEALQEANAQLQVLTAELYKANRELDKLSNTDHLTGLANRMRLDAVLEQESARSKRHGGSFSLILLDIDMFKRVNDAFGHQFGDRVLIEVGHILEKNVRPYDVVGRWGGEEFLIVCSNTNLDGATAIAEKLRTAMAQHAFEVVGSRTASFGVSMFISGESFEETLGRADAALYRAKKNGRNRVELG